MLFNLHTHRPTLSSGILEIESIYFGQSKTPVALNHSVGLHPWYLEGVDLELAVNWLRVEAELSHTLAIGEVGLDKVCKTPWDLQVLAFQHCVAISEAFKKPLIIHCVRAFSEIITLKKQWNPKQTWIFHGFDKNLLTAAMLLKAGCFLSFGAALFKEKSPAAESLQFIPEDRFFLETDDADLSIEVVYERAARIRGLNMEDLLGRIEGNFKFVFNHKRHKRTQN